jgi:hypothetical protein
MLRDGPSGTYHYVPGIPAFSSGVVAASGWEIVHATLHAPVPWRAGFAQIERHLQSQGRPRAALCGIELRSPAPFTFEGFDAFNQGYRALLAEWGILVGDDNPIPRTNVAPVTGAPAEPSLYGFAYTVPGASEMRDRARGAQGIVRLGDTSPEAMCEKARFVMGIMRDRLKSLGGDWNRVTAIEVYTALPIDGALLAEILGPAGAAAIHGIRWFPSRPPIQGLEFEVDMRGVARELLI